MTTVTGDFTAIHDVSGVLRTRDGEGVSYSITGTFDQTIVLEKDNGGGLSWSKVAGPFTDEVTGRYQSYVSERLRFRCIAEGETPGTATYSMTDESAVLREWKDADGNAVARLTQDGFEVLGALAVGGTAIGATAAELNDNDLSARTQNITEAGAIDLDARHVKITGPESSTYAVTLAAPSRAGIVKVVEMVATTDTNAVTLALTNVVGGSSASSASFDAAGEMLVLVSASAKWVVLQEHGVTLS